MTKHILIWLEIETGERCLSKMKRSYLTGLIMQSIHWFTSRRVEEIDFEHIRELLYENVKKN